MICWMHQNMDEIIHALIASSIGYKHVSKCGILTQQCLKLLKRYITMCCFGRGNKILCFIFIWVVMVHNVFGTTMVWFILTVIISKFVKVIETHCTLLGWQDERMRSWLQQITNKLWFFWICSKMDWKMDINL